MALRSFASDSSIHVKYPMNDCSNQNNNCNNHSSLLAEQSLDNSNSDRRQPDHQTVIIPNLEQPLEHHPKPSHHQLNPNYYEWSLCDINSAHDDLFNQMPSRRLQPSISSRNSRLEPLSYFNYKQIGQFSLIYDQMAQQNGIYSPQHFGTSQMRRPHPMRHSIPCEETFRWMPVRSSAIIGRRSHLPLDLFHTTSTIAKK